MVQLLDMPFSTEYLDAKSLVLVTYCHYLS